MLQIVITCYVYCCCIGKQSRGHERFWCHGLSPHNACSKHDLRTATAAAAVVAAAAAAATAAVTAAMQLDPATRLALAGHPVGTYVRIRISGKWYGGAVVVVVGPTGWGWGGGLDSHRGGTYGRIRISSE